MLDICTLGTGGALPLPERALSSLYLRYQGHAFLIDCGEGTQVQIRKLGWGFRCIDGLLITHYHGDHCSGLPGFLLSLAKSGRDLPFHIWGPPGLRRIYEGLMVIAPNIPFDVILHELPMCGGSLQLAGLDIQAFQLSHGVPCFGYQMILHRTPAFDPQKARSLNIPIAYWKVLQQGSSVTLGSRIIKPNEVHGDPKKDIRLLFATDTRPTAAISEYGSHMDLMILEGMYGTDEKMTQAIKNHHMLYREAASLAEAANAGKLLLTHFSTCIEDPSEFLPEARSVFPNTDVAEDGACWTIDAHGYITKHVTSE